jgi:hypothetical protein
LFSEAVGGGVDQGGVQGFLARVFCPVAAAHGSPVKNEFVPFLDGDGVYNEFNITFLSS